MAEMIAYLAEEVLPHAIAEEEAIYPAVAAARLPATADTAAIIARVDAALGERAILAGFSAEAVAVAIRRALTRASSWRDHDWRPVHDEPQDPALHISALGLTAWYQPLNDIASAHGKIGGAAQKRLADGTVLHHVTMAYDMDEATMTRVLRIGRGKLSDKGIPGAAKRVDPLRRQTRRSRAEITSTLIEYFRQQHGLTLGGLGTGELRAARELASTKFTTREWTARVP